VVITYKGLDYEVLLTMRDPQKPKRSGNNYTTHNKHDIVSNKV